MNDSCMKALLQQFQHIRNFTATTDWLNIQQADRPEHERSFMMVSRSPLFYDNEQDHRFHPDAEISMRQTCEKTGAGTLAL